MKLVPCHKCGEILITEDGRVLKSFALHGEKPWHWACLVAYLETELATSQGEVNRWITKVAPEMDLNLSMMTKERDEHLEKRNQLARECADAHGAASDVVEATETFLEQAIKVSREIEYQLAKRDDRELEEILISVAGLIRETKAFDQRRAAAKKKRLQKPL